MSDEAPETNGEEVVELTIDDLFNEQVEADAVKAAEKELLLKAGTWRTVPPLKVKVYKDKTGRQIVSFAGKVFLEGEGNGGTFYRFSPERRNAKNYDTGEDTGKPDRAYKNYVMACKAFRVAYDREPTSVGEVVSYLRDFEHNVRIIQTESLENMVVAISGIRPEATS